MTHGPHERKILILGTSAHIGGAERIACGLARAFDQRGWTVRSVFPESPRDESFLDWCRDQDVQAEANPALRNAMEAHGLKDMLRLRSLVREFQPAVVNIHYGGSFISLKDIFAIRAAGPNTRCVVSVHHPTPWQTTGARKRQLTRAAAALAHEVTTFSAATRDVLLEAGVSPRKLHVIPCGLRAPTTLPTRQEARARLGFGGDAFVIGCLARHETHKGIDDLITAVAGLSDPSARVLLAVGGDGPERARLQAMADTKLGVRCRFLGRVPHVDDFLAACDVFALPSYLEGFGLVYVEAAFHGVPSVGTLVGGVPDAVVANETGLLVPPGDTLALCRALQRLLDDEGLRVKLGAQARARAQAELTEDRMASGFERAFQRRPVRARAK